MNKKRIIILNLGILLVLIIVVSAIGMKNNKLSNNNKSYNKDEENISKEYVEALNEANIYLNTNSFHSSKIEFYDNLTARCNYMFSEDAFKYAVENVDENWKGNALR